MFNSKRKCHREVSKLTKFIDTAKTIFTEKFEID